MADTGKSAIWIVTIVLAGVVIIGTLAALSGGFWGTSSTALQKYVFFGTEDITSEASQYVDIAGGEMGALITAFMVWLIIFAGFGDITENFSAFSRGIAWVISFAVAVVAANTGLIRGGLVWMVKIFAWAGTFTIFAAMFASFIVFFAVNWGITPLMEWIKGRQQMVDAARGRETAASGLKTLTLIGRTSTEEGKK